MMNINARMTEEMDFSCFHVLSTAFFYFLLLLAFQRPEMTLVSFEQCMLALGACLLMCMIFYLFSLCCLNYNLSVRIMTCDHTPPLGVRGNIPRYFSAFDRNNHGKPSIKPYYHCSFFPIVLRHLLLFMQINCISLLSISFQLSSSCTDFVSSWTYIVRYMDQ